MGRPEKPFWRQPVNNLKHFLPKSTFVQNVTVLAGGTAIGQAAYLLALPILTRLFATRDFGSLAIYQSILSFLVVVAAMRYEVAVLLPEDDQTAANLVVIGFLITCLTSLLIALVLWLVPRETLFQGDLQVLQAYWWLLPVGQVGQGTYLVLAHWAIRRRNFAQIAGTKVSQVVGQICTQVVCGALKVGVLGLLVGDVLGRAGGGGTLARLIWSRDRVLFRRVSRQGMLRAAARYRLFPILSAGSCLLNNASLQGPPLLLAALYGSQVLGWYALVTRVASAPFQLIGKSVSQVYMSESARLARENPAALRRLLLTSIRRLFCLGLAPCAVLLLGGAGLFAVVFGSNWGEAGVYAQLMSVMFLTEFVAFPLMPTLNVLEKQAWQLYWDIVRFIITVGGLWFVHYAGGSPALAIFFYGCTMALMYLVLLILCYVAIMGLVERARVQGATESVGVKP